jgi:glycosyltransferase involved in cell wall biosynthesis
MKSHISFLILSLNEEKNLPFALESCKFADKVFVLDSGSTDATREIAIKFGAHLIFHPWEGYARQKNWGLDNLPFETDWIFVLDADESVTTPLRDELVAIATEEITSDKIGYYANRYFVWEGKGIRHCGYYPSWNIRFFKRGKARYEERGVHEHVIVDGEVGYLKGELRHEDRRGRDFLWRKHLKYAELEAMEMAKVMSGGATGGIIPSFFGNSIQRRRAVKERIWPYLPARWIFRFFYMYLLKRGFLDGRAGLDMCMFMARYEREITKEFVKYKEL